ncbi:ArsR family transcriptional regulator [Herbidospora sp. NEAU-GS84]|uniref:ArsR family transcriptional regulator n=1 Tax=Herbidospora solisilvae TaxID=2696284 RepID=A0A7C9N8U3_9ACTN|nr:ArsR family transcriptional regulator [Herbidospora solisilvae]
MMSGRRRQGKTFMLQAICEATGGFYFGATENVPRQEALRQLGNAVGDYLGSPGVIRFENWQQAIDGLLSLSMDRPIPVVLDEFPYLTGDAKELPSIIQHALAPRRKLRLDSRIRLLLCGSSISFMGGLLSGQAPLRGRAGFEMVLPSFNFRVAADYWGLTDRRLAALVYFIVGGTPAYRAEFLEDAVPRSIDDFDNWVVNHVLSPVSPLFREVRMLLAEDPALRETGLYSTVLAAVAEGNNTRGGIASRIERKASDISHHLKVLEDAGMLVSDPDPFRGNRSYYRITEPLVRFHHAIMRPFWSQLEVVRPGRTERIWAAASKNIFPSQVAGPVFERMCRVWTADMASDETVGGMPSKVLSGVVYDSSTRQSHEVDLAAFGSGGELLALGEVKWGDVIGMGHLARLEKVAAVRPARRLLLFSGAGFMPQLEEAARESGGRIQLVGLDRLYEGD